MEESYRLLKNNNMAQQFIRVTPEDVSKFLRDQLGTGYSSHSLKHGAVRAMIEEAASNKLTLQDVMRPSKCKQLGTLLRYSGATETTALALGTQHGIRVL